MAEKKNTNKKPPGLKKVDPLEILLDPKNPRLTAEEEGSPQNELIRIMIERFRVEELAESIISAGYLQFDPLVAWKQNGSITILEGNRRIAALKLLLRPQLAPEKHRRRWIELSNQLSPDTRELVKQVELILYEDRADADVASYIGFRHVTGVLKWPALEKASYISSLVDRKWSYSKIADTLGSHARHIERHYIAHQMVRQATDSDLPGAKNMANAFGVLLRALQAGGISEFLGVTYPSDPKKSVRPVPKDRLENFRYFIEWTFGTEEKSRILPDSRDLTRLGKILQSPAAVGYLKRATRPDFHRAWFKSGGQAESLAEALLMAADRLEESVPLVSQHTANDEVRNAVRECTRYLVQILRYFPDVHQEYALVE